MVTSELRQVHDATGIRCNPFPEKLDIGESASHGILQGGDVCAEREIRIGGQVSTDGA